MKNKISIIIPVYNVENYLKRCIDSILNQTITNFEVIAINDGSTDNSLKILKEYALLDKRIKVINKKNEGVSVARNIGINNSKGQYITFVDADDYLEKNALEIMLNIIKKENVDIVRTTYYRIIDNNKSYETKNNYNGLYKLNKKHRNNIIDSILKQNLKSYLWLLLIKKELIIKNNIYFEKELYVHQDLDYYIKLFKYAKNVYFSDSLTYYYVYNELGSKNIKNIKRNIISNINLSKKLLNILDKSKKGLIYLLSINLTFNYFNRLYNEDKILFNNIYNNLLNNNEFLNMIYFIDKNKLYKNFKYRDRIYFIFVKRKISSKLFSIIFIIKQIKDKFNR